MSPSQHLSTPNQANPNRSLRVGDRVRLPLSINSVEVGTVLHVGLSVVRVNVQTEVGNFGRTFLISEVTPV